MQSLLRKKIESGEIVGVLQTAGLLLVLAAIGALIVSALLDNRAADIAQCMRAFDYTRDQCEFIIKHHVMVTR